MTSSSGWRLPFVFADPHPVVTHDQLSLSSSSSSGTQTGEMLEAGDNRTGQDRNLECGERGTLRCCWRCSY